MEKQPISREGFDKIRDEIRHMEEDEKPKIAEQIALARSEGDLSENAEYHGQREAMAHLDRRIGVLRGKLANAYIVDKSKMPKGVVTFGSVVTIRDLADDMEEKYEFVGPGEEDYTGEVMKILSGSPLASSLMGKKPGDNVEVQLPKGTARYEIVSIDEN